MATNALPETPSFGVSGYTPDILARGLDVVFCGLNPAVSAALGGHNFSHRSNRFWLVLHLAGFTPTRLAPEEEERLLEYGCGITAVVGRPTSHAQDVRPGEFRQSRAAFEAKMRRCAPRSVAFLGKRAFAILTGQPNLRWGRQSKTLAGRIAWVLPNPSGRNAAFTLDALVDAYTELRIAVARRALSRFA
jgi:double-stranded uracil-DNA glycosylase